MGWHCIEQDDTAGESLLLDTAVIFSRMKPDARESLRSVELELPVYARAAGGSERQPLLVERPWGTGVCYSPWLKPFAPTESGIRAYKDFKRLVKEADEGEPSIRIALKAKEALFIDNARVLHGRKAIVSESRRHLRRLWIGEPA